MCPRAQGPVPFLVAVVWAMGAAFAATGAAIEHRTGGGRVINFGNCNAERVPFAGGAVYAMSKSAPVGPVQGLARDLGPPGITVNNVQPGPVDTDVNPAEGPFASSLKALMARPRRRGPGDGRAPRRPGGRVRYRGQPGDRKC